jgi:hypothetical protein
MKRKEVPMNEKNLYTPGYLSQLFQVDPRELESELDEGGYQPEFCINGIAHWGGDALTYLRSIARRLQTGNRHHAD